MSILLRPGLAKRELLMLSLAGCLLACGYYLWHETPVHRPAPGPEAVTRTAEQKLQDAIDLCMRNAEDENARDQTTMAMADYEAAIKLAAAMGDKRDQVVTPIIYSYSEFLYNREYYKRCADVLVEKIARGQCDRKHMIMYGQSLYVIGETDVALQTLNIVLNTDIEYGEVDESQIEMQRNGLMELFLRANNENKARALYQAQIDSMLAGCRDKNSIETRTKLVKLQANLGDLYKGAGKTGEAIAIYQEALKKAIALRGDLDPDTCEIRQSLSRAYIKSKDYARSGKLYSQLLKRYSHTEDEANALTHVASYYWETKDFERAETYLKRALALRARQYKSDSKMVLGIEENLIPVLQWREKSAEASQLISRTQHTKFPEDEYNLYIDALNSENFDQAVNICLRKIAAIEKQIQSKAPDSAERFNVRSELRTWQDYLSSAYADSGRFTLAREVLECQYNAAESHMRNPDRLAKVYLQLGESEKAERLYQDYIAKTESATREQIRQQGSSGYGIRTTEDNAEACGKLAQFYFDRQNWSKAENVLRLTIDQLEKNGLSHRPCTIIARGNLAQVYCKQGRTKDARRVIKELLNNDLVECSENVGHDPISSFYTQCLFCTTSGTTANEYLTAKKQRRSDAELNIWLWSEDAVTEESTIKETNKPFFGGPQMAYEKELPFLDWYRIGSEDKRVLRVAALIQLSKLYEADNDETEARIVRGQALATMRTIMRLAPRGSYSTTDQAFEYLLKRLPTTDESKRLLTKIKEAEKSGV